MDMLHALVSGFLQCFTLSTFNLMMIGIAIGFVVGILPGLGGPTAMALMLPFVFKMSAVEAFAFLLGMTAVTATTGDITSVLFGVPGEPTTASTIVDGHAMARNGEAGRALGAVLMSSLVGAVFAGVALGAAIPIIRPLVLSFGSPEFFMLAILGISFVAALSGEDAAQRPGCRRHRAHARDHRFGSDLRHSALHLRSTVSLGRYRSRADHHRLLRHS